MTILAAGYGLRNLANQGMRSVAELEAQENAIADQLDAAEQAQKTQMYSTGAGIGGSFGVNSALEAGKTVAKKRVPKAKKGSKSSKPNHDACYHKIKRQYKVFPSAYASGAIAKCRKRRG